MDQWEGVSDTGASGDYQQVETNWAVGIWVGIVSLLVNCLLFPSQFFDTQLGEALQPKIFADIVLKSPHKPRAHLWLGNYYYQRGQREMLVCKQAEDQLKAQCILEIHKVWTDKALKEFATVVRLAKLGYTDQTDELFHYEAQASSNAAKLYDDMGRTSEALGILQPFLLLDLPPEIILSQWVGINLKLNQFDKVEQVADHWLKAYPGSYGLLRAKGEVEASRGNCTKAFGWYEKAREVEFEFHPSPCVELP